MSDDVTPGADEGPEVLDSQHDPIEPVAVTSPAKSRRGLIWGVVGAVALAGVGVGAFAAYRWFTAGAQPAEMVPADALAYVMVDADPTGDQKIEAFKFLRKFPGIDEELDLGDDDDLLQQFFDWTFKESDCDLDYETDVKPWIGTSIGVAALPNPDAEAGVDVIGVLNISDSELVKDGIEDLLGCEDDAPFEYVITDDWVVFAETEAIAQDAVDEAADSALIDDSDFAQWTDEVGDAGVVNAYMSEDFLPTVLESAAEDLGDPAMTEVFDMYESMGAGALTIRFADAGVEMEAAGSLSTDFAELIGLDTDATVSGFQDLPSDTLAAMSFVVPEGYVENLLELAASQEGDTPDEFAQEMEQGVPLDIPEDLETLFGDEVTVVLGGGFDPEVIANSSDPSSIGLALKIKGDPEEIQAILIELNAALGSEFAEFTENEISGDYLIITPDDSLREQIAEGGNLGETELAEEALGDLSQSGSVMFIDFDGSNNWLVQLLEGDESSQENAEPLSALGVNVWRDGDVMHWKMRLSTD